VHSPVTSQPSEAARDAANIEYQRGSDTSGSGSASRGSWHGSYRSDAAAGAAFYACVDEIVRAVCPLLEGIACKCPIKCSCVNSSSCADSATASVCATAASRWLFLRAVAVAAAVTASSI
jgi:hypothetical protein